MDLETATFNHTTASETRHDTDGTWIWRLQQPTQPNTTSSETRHDMEGSWIWRLQLSIAAKLINMFRKKTLHHRKLDMTRMEHGSGDCNIQSQPWISYGQEEGVQLTDQPIDTEAFARLFSTSLDPGLLETRHDTDTQQHRKLDMTWMDHGSGDFYRNQVDQFGQEENVQLTDQPIDIAASARLLYPGLLETRHDTDTTEHRKLDLTWMDHRSGDSNDLSQPNTQLNRKVDMKRMDHGSGDSSSQSQPSASIWTGRCARSLISQLTPSPSFATFLHLLTPQNRRVEIPKMDHGSGDCKVNHTTALETTDAADGSGRLQQSITAKWINLVKVHSPRDDS
ncbi:MAG: hypothetical protein J3Q66DRAFT_401060 [Benniella sp.]|nr:MAG: hypothetical protein J3Q66DRAFT_408236 [Benniella sp.]KAK3817673.1 MAG: hypothetical protein J3Q66DRAFT_401058 [Benniella sp.]KAK3817675.1 MAG: hypothetical protein J3Q66DRAFT_401060 [Benniella sp.]